MLIDWFTVIAQIINFLLLLWLLKRFLFTPVLTAIDERENKIKAQIEEAQLKVIAAEAERQTFHQKNKDFEIERDGLFTEAVNDANAKHKVLMEGARIEAEALRIDLDKALREDQQNISREIRERTQQEVIAIARKVLSDLASTSLEENVVAVFIHRLNQLEGEEKKRLVESLQKASNEIIVKSAFGLSSNQQEAIEKAIIALTTEKNRCRFEISPQKISGIELNVDGYKMAWSVSDYLDSLEKALAELLDGHPDFQPTSNPGINEPTIR